jgi:hypothetical protein
MMMMMMWGKNPLFYVVVFHVYNVKLMVFVAEVLIISHTLLLFHHG